MHTVVVYSPNNNARLTYVLDWLLKERLQLQYLLNPVGPNSSAIGSITYGANSNGFSIPVSGFLEPAKVLPLTPQAGEWQGIPTLFAVGVNDFSLPFDLFAAIFYLLSRYEEYLPYTADRHSRFPHTESILHKQGCLHRPVADEWVWQLRLALCAAWGVMLPPLTYHFQPTYDIDIAFSHSFKGITRLAGAYLKALLKGDIAQLSEKTQVLKKKQKDPYDSFEWLRQLHERNGSKALYFILCALNTTAFDKNISPRHPAMTRVIRQLAKEAQLGIHPSYYATQLPLLAAEKNTLEEIAATKIHISRQHYIKLKIPATYRLLLAGGVDEDYSMGYGAHTGFRAGTGSSFMWYDIENEQVAPLRIYPFCFMDTTAHYEMGLNPQQAFTELNRLATLLNANGGTLTTIFHNFSLGTATEWHCWQEKYMQFLEDNSK
ncbi:MAG: polysaccharide deacetylase family protein [Taibaiella sp.]|nr:polysaccharide deacetylase family protein [Taibaiella sp.]